MSQAAALLLDAVQHPGRGHHIHPLGASLQLGPGLVPGGQVVGDDVRHMREAVLLVDSLKPTSLFRPFRG